jgi:hypothetical protein
MFAKLPVVMHGIFVTRFSSLNSINGLDDAPFWDVLCDLVTSQIFFGNVPLINILGTREAWLKRCYFLR